MSSIASQTSTFPVMESFYTIQGEGYHSGKPAYFIRLAGCDVGCVWCDVKESWTATENQNQTIENIVDGALEHPVGIVVITGGEPCMYNLEPLTTKLHEKGFRIHLETSGAYSVKGNLDWICVSPKKFKSPLSEVLILANELKVVIFHPSDFAWAEKNALTCVANTHLFVQPEYDKMNQLMPAVVDFVKSNTNWRISLQSHKFIGIP